MRIYEPENNDIQRVTILAFSAGKGPKNPTLKRQPGSENHQLETLYNKFIKIHEHEENFYQALFKFILESLIKQMKRYSEDFRQLYRETYYGGSFYDGLKIGTTKHEFDVNIVFDIEQKDIEIKGLGKDRKKENFCFISLVGKTAPKNRCIVERQTSERTISPLKMFQLMQSALDRVLSKINNKISYQGKFYRVTRQIFAPITLKIIGLEDDVEFEVDLVPSMKIGIETLRKHTKTYQHIKGLCDQGFQMPSSLMAISLHKVDKEKFQLDFHDLEREILFNRNCGKKVIFYKYLICV